MNIRARLTLLVVLAITVPGLLVGLRFIEDRTAAVDSATVALSHAARAIADELDDKVQGTAQLHYGLARARDLDTEDRAACSRFLSRVREKYPQYTGIITITPEGRLFCDSLQTGRDLDLRDRGYFQKALQSAEDVTLEPVFGRLTGTAVLQIAHPARDEAGTLKFVLLASLNLRSFVEAHRLPLPGAEIMLVDAAGTVLAATPRPAPDRRIGGQIADSALFALLREDRDGVAPIIGLSGEREVWATATTARIGRSGLNILVGLPEASLRAAANEHLVEGLAGLAAIMLVLLVGVWTLAEVSIRRQVGRIAAMVARLGQGDLAARIDPPHPKGELGELMAVLNRAAESLAQQRAAIDTLNQKLQQAQRLEAVGQLTGGIAHDFNNLLTIILGNATSLAEHLAADRQFGPLAEMTAKAAQRGADLTSRLLAFARRQPLDPRPTDIGRQIGEMDRLVRRTLGSNIDMALGRPAGLWRAMVDPVQLESAILNLCLNARDAMPKGGRLTIEAANVAIDAQDAARQDDLEPGDYVMVAVSDTGTGMDPATLRRAFEPFFTTKEMGRGSGLGLSMVYGFVKQSKGHVRIYSEPGQGTTVKLYLPRAEGEAAPVAAAATPEPLRRGSETILLVEDDDMVREHVHAQLISLGYRVLTARGGAEAIDRLTSPEPVDLLFTDVIMPGGIGGPELAAAALSLRPGLPILFTSGYTENAIVHHGRLDPGVHLLAKPYRRQELAEKLRSLLDRDDIAAPGPD
ncbi:MAG: ATP-binding protein [Thalassobaculales bacterium]